MKQPPAAPGSDGVLASSFCCRLQGTWSWVEFCREKGEEEGEREHSASGAQFVLSSFDLSQLLIFLFFLIVSLPFVFHSNAKY